MEIQVLRELGLWEGAFCRATRRISRLAHGKMLRHACGLRVYGVEQLAGLRQCIFAPTHASHLDFWAVLEGLPAGMAERTYTAAAADYFYRSWRRLTTELVSYNNFPFDRNQASTRGYQQLLKILAAGYSLLMFAQGSRTRTGSLLPLKPFLAMVALAAEVPVVPVAVRGTFEILPPGRIFPRPHPVEVIFGTPLDPRKIKAVGSGKPLNKQAHVFNQQLMQALTDLWHRPL